MKARSGSLEMMMNTWFAAGEAGRISLSSSPTGSRSGSAISPPTVRSERSIGNARTVRGRRSYSNADAAGKPALIQENHKAKEGRARENLPGAGYFLPRRRYLRIFALGYTSGLTART
jgi:hypothetical protein